MKLATTEAGVLAAVVEYLSAWGGYPVRVNSGAMYAGEQAGRKRFVRFNSEPGCTDILCCLPDGRFAAIECKRPGWKLDLTDPRQQRQEAFIWRVKQRGGVGGFVAGIDDLRGLLREAGYHNAP